jgi:hypothetical protein
VTFPGSKSNPLYPSFTSSGIPPIFEAMTGLPDAKDSSIAIPKTSYQIEGRTVNLLFAIIRFNSYPSLNPANSIFLSFEF